MLEPLSTRQAISKDTAGIDGARGAYVGIRQILTFSLAFLNRVVSILVVAWKHW